MIVDFKFFAIRETHTFVREKMESSVHNFLCIIFLYTETFQKRWKQTS